MEDEKEQSEKEDPVKSEAARCWSYTAKELPGSPAARSQDQILPRIPLEPLSQISSSEFYERKHFWYLMKCVEN